MQIFRQTWMLSPTANQKVGNEDTKRGTGVDDNDRENVKISDKERNLQTTRTKMENHKQV